MQNCIQNKGLKTVYDKGCCDCCFYIHDFLPSHQLIEERYREWEREKEGDRERV